MTQYGSDGWTKSVRVAKRMHQGGRSVTVWAGIVVETIIKPFRFDENDLKRLKNDVDFL